MSQTVAVQPKLLLNAKSVTTHTMTHNQLRHRTWPTDLLFVIHHRKVYVTGHTYLCQSVSNTAFLIEAWNVIYQNLNVHSIEKLKEMNHMQYCLRQFSSENDKRSKMHVRPHITVTPWHISLDGLVSSVIQNVLKGCHRNQFNFWREQTDGNKSLVSLLSLLQSNLWKVP